MPCNNCTEEHELIRIQLEKYLDCGCDCHEIVVNENCSTSDGCDAFNWNSESI